MTIGEMTGRQGEDASGEPAVVDGTSCRHGRSVSEGAHGRVSVQAERGRWDERYRSAEASFPDWAAPLVREAVSLLHPPGLALDLACGLGRHALFLGERGFQVVAVDLSRVALDRLARRARDRGLPVWPVQADLGTFDLPHRSFDLVVNTHFLERVLFPVIRRALKQGGYVVFATFTVDEIERFGRDLPRRFLLEKGELIRKFGRFEIVKYEETVLRHCQHGPRAMVRLIARKPDGRASESVPAGG